MLFINKKMILNNRKIMENKLCQFFCYIVFINFNSKVGSFDFIMCYGVPNSIITGNTRNLNNKLVDRLCDQFKDQT